MLSSSASSDLQRLTRLDSVQIIYHHVHRRVGRSHEQFRQIATSRLKGDIGGAEVLQDIRRA